MNAHTFNFTLREIATALGGEVSGKQVVAPGPGHSADDRSLSVKPDGAAPGGFIVHSHASDDPLKCKDYVRDKMGVRWEPTTPPRDSLARMADRVSKPVAKADSPPATYIYKQDDGTPYLRVVRPGFYQSHWIGGAWVSGAPKGPKIPYRLPELRTSRHDDVVIVEGEKDADNVAALGFTVTTNPGGAGKFPAELAEYFKGKNVYILPDNDPAGEDHAKLVTETLHGIARTVRVVHLPGLAAKGDVSDWIEAGGTVDDLADLMRHAPEIKPEEPLSRFKFETFSDLKSLPPAEYLMDGWIPERSVGLLYGKWGSGKSFLGFDWCLHLAFGLPDWHGVKLPGEPTDVLIIAREGHAGFVKRVAAFMQHRGITDEPSRLVFMRSSISFLDDTAFAALKDDIKALGRTFRFVLVDTVGRVLPGADMAKEAPITLFMERLQQVGEITGGTAVGVHHENKAGDANGSMFFQNNSDFMFSISREGDGPLKAGKITCAKQKEGDDMWSRDITFAKIDLPDFKTSLVVESVSEEASSPSARKRSTWPKGLRLVRDCINAAILEASLNHRVGGDGPVVRAAVVSDARKIHEQRYVSSGEGNRAEAERKAWRRGLNEARNSELIGGETVNGRELVWMVHSPDSN
ncbi:AAA family ATPase [Bradyrhizobium sp. 4]|uniref:AAA family ATPase n=1 Tax=unclassified Bradyrhizobium TaxID=2631580 RepID=UPI001FF86300|nr:MULTISPECIES: AAA family ATPase [unclassified Bradyrhizobium]MCK1400125.1 AAA family ATPase [Bradyrhizobium sp. 39]MCK1750415.1 AAA family ATPase [Bradyrhizobium sp. 135]UPJ32024.1 AAA family ATPase [Bradyrhizobium sp. 4]